MIYPTAVDVAPVDRKPLIKPKALGSEFEKLTCFSELSTSKLLSFPISFLIFSVPHVRWIEYRGGCFDTKYFHSISVLKEDHCKYTCQIERSCITARFDKKKKMCYLASNRERKVLQNCQYSTDLFEKGLLKRVLYVSSCWGAPSLRRVNR